MKTKSTLLQKSLLVLGIFSVTTFVTYGASSTSEGLLKSTPYQTRSATADSQLSTMTNGSGAAILDKVIADVKTRAETKGGTPLNVSSYNAYIDGRLALLDELDNQVRLENGTDDYSFLFKYLYPRVYELKQPVSQTTSLLERIGTAMGLGATSTGATTNSGTVTIAGTGNVNPKSVYTKSVYKRGETLQGYVEGGDVNNTWGCMDSPNTKAGESCLDKPSVFRQLTKDYLENGKIIKDGWQVNPSTGRIENGSGLFIESFYPYGTYTGYTRAGLTGTPVGVSFTLAPGASGVVLTDSLGAPVTSLSKSDKLFGTISGTDPNNTWACAEPATSNDCENTSSTNSGWRKLGLAVNGVPDDWQSVNGYLENKNGSDMSAFPLQDYKMLVKNGPTGTYSTARLSLTDYKYFMNGSDKVQYACGYPTAPSNDSVTTNRWVDQSKGCWHRSTTAAVAKTYQWGCIVAGPVNVNTSGYACSASNAGQTQKIDGWDCTCN